MEAVGADIELARVRGRWSPGALTVVGWGVGAGVTVLILFTPWLRFGYRSPSAHLVLDTVDACVALLVAYLVYGRFLRSHRAQDMLLAQGLVLLAAAGAGLTYVVDAASRSRPGVLDVWLPLSVRVAGTALVAAAALAAGRPAGTRARGAWIWTVPAVVVVAAVLVLWPTADSLPLALDPDHAPPSAQHPLITGHGLLLAAQGLMAVCFMVASVAFARQAGRSEDALLRWLGPACALGAFARVNYLLFPSLYTDWLYTGDLLRTGCYLLLLVGAAREIREYWTAQTRAAVLEDRRRLARELHDGVIQELGYIRSEGHAITSDVSRSTRIVAACDRALDEARAAVHALAHPDREPLARLLRQGAGLVADRHLVHLELDLDAAVMADPDQLHALVRITREAVSNAARHGKAGLVRVRLATDGGRRLLEVEDDGVGFDVAGTLAGGTGYGLVSMRERAEGLPGDFEVDSAPERGSAVRVRW